MLRGLAIVLLVHALGCGRVSFDAIAPSTDDGAVDDSAPADGSVIAPDQIVVHVMTDRYASEASVPVAGARVVIADGASTTAMTDANGRATFHSAVPAEIHAGYVDGTGVSVAYSVADAQPGAELELGGRYVGTRASMTVHLPTDDASAAYYIYVPTACGTNQLSSTADASASYERACEGMSVPAMAVSNAPGGPHYIDLGSIDLVEGGDVSRTSLTWATLPLEQHVLSNLPATTASVELTPVGKEPVTGSFITTGIAPVAAAVGTNATCDVHRLVGEYIGVIAHYDTYSRSIRFLPYAAGDYDANGMTGYVSEASSSGGTISWSESSTTANITTVEAAAIGHRFVAVFPHGPTSVAFPTDVGVTAGTSPYFASIAAWTKAAPYEAYVATGAQQLTTYYGLRTTMDLNVATGFTP